MATCQAPFQQQWKVRTTGARGRQMEQYNLDWPRSSSVFFPLSHNPHIAAPPLTEQRVFSYQHLNLTPVSAARKERDSFVSFKIQARQRIRWGPLPAQANSRDQAGDGPETSHEKSAASTAQPTVEERSPLERDPSKQAPRQSEEGCASVVSDDEAPQVDEQGGSFSRLLSGPLQAFKNAEWLHKRWDIPWGYRTTLAVYFASQLLAGWVGQLAGNGVVYALGSELAGTQLQRFCSRVAAYLSIAVILEVFLANQKRLKESPFEMSSGGRWWRHLKWVALWLCFRVLWGGVISRGLVLPRMCKAPSSFPIEFLPDILQYKWSAVNGVEGLSAATAASLAKFAGTLNVALDLLVAPWFEEAFFRGFVQASLSKPGQHPLPAILLTAALQGSSFLSRTGFCGVQPATWHPVGLRLRWLTRSMVSAVVYGTIFQKTRSLLPGVLLHQLETLSRVLVFAYERGPFWTAYKLSFLVLSSAGQ